MARANNYGLKTRDLAKAGAFAASRAAREGRHVVCVCGGAGRPLAGVRRLCQG